MKLGLGDSYDDVSVLTRKTRAYIDLTKPASSVGVGFAYGIGSMFYFLYTAQQIDFNSIIFVSLTMFLAHSASQAMNMAEDAEMDRATPHKQNRPIPAGVVSEDEARSLAWIVMMFAIGRAYMVNATFGGVVTLLAFFGIFYNLQPIRAKERVVSIPWQAVSRGLLLFPAIWAAYGNLWTPLPWVLGAFMFFYVLGFQNSADIIDAEVDREYGVKTFVVEYGVDGVAMIASGSMIMMMAVVIIAESLGYIPERLFWILAIIPFCFIMLYHMSFHPHRMSNRTGNHPAWLWFYIGMVLAVTIPFMVELSRSYL